MSVWTFYKTLNKYTSYFTFQLTIHFIINTLLRIVKNSSDNRLYEKKMSALLKEDSSYNTEITEHFVFAGMWFPKMH